MTPDAERWAAFCRTLPIRIQAIRADEGINGRREPWQTFERPLPGTVLPPAPRQVGPIISVPRTARCAYCGQFLRPEQRGQRYCSLACYARAKTQPPVVIDCPCGESITVPRWMAERKRSRRWACSRPCYDRYRTTRAAS